MNDHAPEERGPDDETAPSSDRTTARRALVWAARVLGLAVVGTLAVWLNCEYTRTQSHLGLDGEWVEEPASVPKSYMFARNGEFYEKGVLPPAGFAPFTGDDGTRFRLAGTWSRNGQTVTVASAHNWSLVLDPTPDGKLAGTHVAESVDPRTGKSSQTNTPIVLRQK